jgi:NlpC/P60 family
VTYTVAQELVVARSWLGVPYLFGGTTRAGVDCSGYTQAVAVALGIIIERTSEEQWATLGPGDGSEGDYVFFDVPSDAQAQPAHVGIVAPPQPGLTGWMLNAPYTGTVVRYDTINGLGRTVMGYRRLPGLVAPPEPSEEEPVPVLVEWNGSYWVVSADLTTKVRVATTVDGSNLSAAPWGYKTGELSAAQMAAIPVVG